MLSPALRDLKRQSDDVKSAEQSRDFLDSIVPAADGVRPLYVRYIPCSAPDDGPLFLVAAAAVAAEAAVSAAAAAAAVVHTGVTLAPPPPLLARRRAVAAAHDGQGDRDQRDEGDERDGDDQGDQVLGVEPLLHHVLQGKQEE